MAITDVRLTVIEIINAVQRRLGVNSTTTIEATKHATMLLGLLNHVIDELSDTGDWQELYHEITVTASSSVGTYPIGVTNGFPKNIYEVSFESQVSPLFPQDIQDIRRLQRGGGYGTPRHYCIAGVATASGNPLMRVHPIPGSAQNNQTFNVALYKKPNLLSTSDNEEEPAFPAQILIQGLYAKALLEENGGEPNRQYEVAYAEYERAKTEHLNRFNADLGTDVWFVPGRGR